MKILMDGLRVWAHQEYPSTPTQMASSHGGLRDFSSELTKNKLKHQGAPSSRLKLFMEGLGNLGTLVLSAPRVPQPTQLKLLMED